MQLESYGSLSSVTAYVAAAQCLTLADHLLGNFQDNCELESSKLQS